MGGLFKQKKTTPEVATVADPYGGVRSGLTSWLESQIGKPAEQYKGEMVSGMSPYEKESLKWLTSYGSQVPSVLRTTASSEIQKSLTGGYDPTTSPYYQAVKAEAARNLQDVQKGVADEAAGGGRYWTGARLKVQGEEAGKTANYLNQLLAQQAENERQRQISVLPYAQSFAEAEEQAPLQKATAMQTLGALPRTISDAQNQAIYQEWLRATQQYPMQVAQMASGVQQAPVYGQVGYQQSPFQQYIQPWLTAAQNAMMLQALK